MHLQNGKTGPFIQDIVNIGNSKHQASIQGNIKAGTIIRAGNHEIS